VHDGGQTGCMAGARRGPGRVLDGGETGARQACSSEVRRGPDGVPDWVADRWIITFKRKNDKLCIRVM
jgi:hypothetical protein